MAIEEGREDGRGDWEPLGVTFFTEPSKKPA